MAMRARDIQTLRSLLSEALSPLHGRLSGIPFKRDRSQSTSSERHPLEWENFTGKSAYEVLGVSQSSSFAEIKSSFRKLAKETHPDVVSSLDNNNSAASQQFIQILAAYEILSDSKKRAHYDTFLLSQKRTRNNQNMHHNIYTTYTTNQSIVITRESNVVEWLKWYRLTVDDIISHKRTAEGSSYLDKLENELYSAVRSAYYGPNIGSMDLLPDCFEAEERSAHDTSELLHLVSGRDLFGIVHVVDDSIKKLSHKCQNNFISTEKDTCQKEEGLSGAYKDLELHICGKIVATASRRAECNCIDESSARLEDHIHVFLALDQLDSCISDRHRVLLGTITGLETSGEEGSCTVYDANGTMTHTIMKHRTLLVKHMHWYRVGGEVSICECRSSRARLPPSRYWLFEPRCYMHDIGGWYVETFGRDNKGRAVLSPRHWGSFADCTEKRLHPAMYLMALAYRSLDLEVAHRRKWSMLKFDFLDHLYKKFFSNEV
ncbi:Chaperone protein DnaJ [Rhynchospora pubera]|uniref:Chaperone protein DnaJ n=1 Tax=Rhynchospora pubera TaxID=906938 RepID=A0AAV8GNP8_9POAL|nr:Chaperone protein DnaJ [Rhynchospora pubera]